MVKKIIPGLILLSTLVAPAQNQWGYGIKFGLVLSKQHFEWLTQPQPPFAIPDLTGFFDSRPGPYMGIFVDFPQKSWISFQTGLNYHQRGAQKDFEIRSIQEPEGSGEFITVDELLEYLGVNAAIKLKAHLQSLSPFLVGGATFNVLLKDKSPGLFLPGEMKRVVPGLLLGGGLEILGTVAGGLVFEMRYEFDIADAAKSEHLKMKQRLWQFLVGVRLK